MRRFFVCVCVTNDGASREGLSERALRMLTVFKETPEGYLKEIHAGPIYIRPEDREVLSFAHHGLGVRAMVTPTGWWVDSQMLGLIRPTFDGRKLARWDEKLKELFAEHPNVETFIFWCQL